ncbi:MAG: hypothetical protein AAF385_00210 [Pseudomonadota bacterium]
MNRDAQKNLEMRFEAELSRYIASFDGSAAHWKTLQAVMRRRFPQCELLDHWETRDGDSRDSAGVRSSLTFAYICNGRETKRRFEIPA